MLAKLFRLLILEIRHGLDDLLLENGDHLVLEDGVSAILLE